MFEKLKAYLGKKIVLELVNGRVIPGTLLAADQRYVKVETVDSLGIIPVNAVQIIWETKQRSLTEENMAEIAQKLRDSAQAEIACSGIRFDCTTRYICSPPDTCAGSFSCPFRYIPSLAGSQCPVNFVCGGTQFYGLVGPDIGISPGFGVPAAGQTGQADAQAQIACTSFPGFTCARSYICRPPDTCTFSFACPGSYVPGFPSGGGACPIFFCSPFLFNQPCGPFTFGQPCGPFQFGQPCTALFACGTFQFSPPCGPFTFTPPPPCGPFTFGLPCGPFQFGGSQCGAPGGFVCPGQQFIGAAPGVQTPGTTAGMGSTPPLPPLSPTEYEVKQEAQNKNDKEKRE